MRVLVKRHLVLPCNTVLSNIELIECEHFEGLACVDRIIFVVNISVVHLETSEERIVIVDIESDDIEGEDIRFMGLLGRGYC